MGRWQGKKLIMASWYIVIDEKKVGPFSGAQLKQLAASGRLEPTATICKDKNGDQVAAGSFKGLFVSLDEISPTPPPLALPKKPVSVSTPARSFSLMGMAAYPIFVLVLLSLLGTIGLLTQQWQNSKEAKALLAAANQDWTNASKKEAVEKYRAAIPLIPAKSVPSDLVERVVRQDFADDRADSAEALLISLLQQGATFQFNSAETTVALQIAEERVKSMKPRETTHVSLSDETQVLVDSSDFAYILTVQNATPETSRMDSLEDPIFVGDAKRKLLLRQGAKAFLYNEKPPGSGEFVPALNYGQMLLKSEFSVRGEDRNIFTPLSFYGERVERFPGSFQQFEIAASVFDDPDKDEFDCHIRQISILTVTDSFGHSTQDPPVEFFLGGTASRLK